ncbi:MAG: TIR domain-containing protein [Gaiellaceae bacterium]
MPRTAGTPNRNYPALTLEKALELPRTLQNGASGLPTDRLTLSQLLDRSPSSSGFHQLVLSSRAFGLTTGGKNADQFALTDIGRDAVSDDPATQMEGMRQAVMNIQPFRAFVTAYDKKKIPATPALKAFLANQGGVRTERLDEALAHLLRDVRTAGLIRRVKDTEYIDLQGTAPAEAPAEDLEDALAEEDGDGDAQGLPEADGAKQPVTLTPTTLKSAKVFISHGRNEAIAQQLKELLTFGKFEPVIAKEQETVSKPVPEKVMEEMRECSAAVIHVATEERLLDEQGKERTAINENVLIEIGAAMALYSRNFILLVPRGLRLPSNLQGLYRCEYEGDSLDYEATMKLLKAFNDFR